MKIPPDCPICHASLKPSLGGVYLYCEQAEDHALCLLMGNIHPQEVSEIFVAYHWDKSKGWRNQWFRWNLPKEQFELHSSPFQTSMLPFFVPNLNNYPSLQERLKTILVFS